MTACITKEQRCAIRETVAAAQIAAGVLAVIVLAREYYDLLRETALTPAGRFRLRA